MTAIFLHLLVVFGESPPLIAFSAKTRSDFQTSTIDGIEKRVFFTPRNNIPYR